MPEIRRYEVFEGRRCEVEANSHEDAMRIAAAKFDNIDPPKGIWGRVTKVPRVIELRAEEI